MALSRGGTSWRASCRVPEGSGRTSAEAQEANAEKRLEELLKASSAAGISSKPPAELGARRVRRKKQILR